MSEGLLLAEALLRIHKEGLAAALATVIEVSGSVPRRVGSKMLVMPDGSIVGTVGGGKMESLVIRDAQNALQTGEAVTVEYALNDIAAGDPGICGGTLRLFIEPLIPVPTLLVIGAGHVGKALAELGKWSGFRVVISDDRAEFCNASYLPNMDGYLPVPPAELPNHIKIDRHTYITAVTRGLPIDEKLLPVLLTTEAAYIGVIGSRRRWALTVRNLEEQGFTREQISRIHAPLGLELNAETPHEIAISIMAEIIMLRRGGDGKPMGKL